MAVIEVIATFYNDSFLAPYFFSHYAWADSIRAMIDSATTDDTWSIAASYPNVRPMSFTFPGGMDDINKANFLTAWYRSSDADWVIVVDSDELLYVRPMSMPLRTFIEGTHMSDLIVAKLYQVYRHWSDPDLDPSRPALPQRRHGDPNTSLGVNREYNKPCIIRGGKDVDLHVGCHYLSTYGKFTVGGNNCYGAHWVMADPCFCVDRRLRARTRQSQRNLDKGLSAQHHNVTVESIMDECYAHCDDPEVI